MITYTILWVICFIIVTAISGVDQSTIISHLIVVLIYALGVCAHDKLKD